MNSMLRLNFLVVCAGLTFGASIFAADTDSSAPAGATNLAAPGTVAAYLQIQEELHNTQMAIEHNRQQA